MLIGKQMLRMLPLLSIFGSRPRIPTYATVNYYELFNRKAILSF